MRSQYATPALVLGEPHFTTLGVIRALARTGIPHYTVGAGRSFVSYCRWHRRLPGRPENDPSPESLAAFLESLSFERMVLLPCSDNWVAAVSRLGPGLAARFPASIAPPEAINICLDKGHFAETMMRLGLPHPRTIVTDPCDDIRGHWDSSLRNPFLKPRNSFAFQRRYGVKALRVRSADEAMTQVRDTRQAEAECLLQEHIPGAASTHYMVNGFISREGTVCARIARRRVRALDEFVSDSSCTVTIPLEEAKAMVHTLERLFPALRYRGIFNAQFKYDERDGQFKLLEINPRFGNSVIATVSCGVNTVEMAYRDALGLPVDCVAEYPIGRYWIRAAYDRRVCRQRIRAGQLTIGDWLRTRIGAVQDIFSWDDPLPAIVNFTQAKWQGIRRRLAGAR